uniref:La-related protein 7 n=1 Tax=Phlebotomus papatasi TaxID=29031 RepID=A0A1B0DAC4_PHLPP
MVFFVFEDVPIEVFLSFNRMKQLTDSTKDIVKSLAKSQLLQLSEDETKVRRKTKINWKIDSDGCTIYVEGLPSKADHEWMKNAFSSYGNVVYVSLPKYSGSKRIKQFGFVEFECCGSVEKTLKAFQKFGGVLSSEMDPAGLQSVVSFNLEQKEKAEGVEGEEKDAAVEEEEPPKKKLKVDEGESEEKAETEENEGESAQESAQEDEKVDEGGKEDKKTHRRKRHKAKKKSSGERDTIFDLKIMTKKEWKRLRNKYLNLQREKFREAKIALQGGANCQRNAQRSPTLTISSKSPGSMNFYGESKPVANTGISMEKGLILELKLTEPLVDVKDFKAELRQYDFVKYVDVKEGTMAAYVRVDSPEAAEELQKRYTDPERQATILSGEAEAAYWQKIAQDRDAKIKKVVKVEKPKRGREKIKKKINQHIFFGQDDDKE